MDADTTSDDTCQGDQEKLDEGTNSAVCRETRAVARLMWCEGGTHLV
jgi:hypothetical protein